MVRQKRSFEIRECSHSLWLIDAIQRSALWLLGRKFFFHKPAAVVLVHDGLSNLNACDHWLRRKPGMHHKMHKDSMAPAAPDLPISSVSHPNAVRISVTRRLARSSSPQMNMVGFPSLNFGLYISVFPALLKALTRLASGNAFCVLSISESPGPVKKRSTPSLGGSLLMGLDTSMTTFPLKLFLPAALMTSSVAEPGIARTSRSPNAALSA